MMSDWYDGRGWHMDGSMGAGGWVMMFLLALTFLALIGGLVYAFTHATHGVAHSAPGAVQQPAARTPAETTLDERYARGEIDEAEYRHRKSVLRGG